MADSLKHKKCVVCGTEWTTADLTLPCPNKCKSKMVDYDSTAMPLVIPGPPSTALESQIGGVHYKQFKIQPVEFCQVNNLGYCESSAIKYLCRWKDKDGLKDLKKAIHFIEMLVELEQGKELAN